MQIRLEPCLNMLERLSEYSVKVHAIIPKVSMGRSRERLNSYTDKTNLKMPFYNSFLIFLPLIGSFENVVQQCVECLIYLLNRNEN